MGPRACLPACLLVAECTPQPVAAAAFFPTGLPNSAVQACNHKQPAAQGAPPVHLTLCPAPVARADMRLRTPSAEDFHCSLQELLERGEAPHSAAPHCPAPTSAPRCYKMSSLLPHMLACFSRQRCPPPGEPCTCGRCPPPPPPIAPACRHPAPGDGGGVRGHHSRARVCQAPARPGAVLPRAGVVVSVALRPLNLRAFHPALHHTTACLPPDAFSAALGSRAPHQELCLSLICSRTRLPTRPPLSYAPPGSR